MADLNTNINIIVKNLSKLKSLKKELQQSSDLAKAISKDFDRLDTLQKRSRRALKPLDDIGRTDPRDSKGRFTKDPNRKRRQELYNKGIEKEIQLEQRLQRIRQREIGSNTVVKQEIAHLKEKVIEQRKENKEIQTKIQRTAKLKAAQGLVGRKLREAGSAGLSPTEFAGGEGKRPAARRAALNQEVTNIKTGFEALRSAGVKNVETYRALGSQLSRAVEELNALNKASARRSIGFEKGRRLQERIDVLDPAKGAKSFGGVKPSAIATARKTAGSVIAAGKTGDQNLYNQALAKATAQVSRLEREYKAGLAAEKAKIAAAKKLEAAQRQQARQQQEAERQENQRLQVIRKAAQLQKRLNNLLSKKVSASFSTSKAGQMAGAKSAVSSVDFLGKSSQEMYNRALIKATTQVEKLEVAYKEAEAVQKKSSAHNKKAQRRLANIRKIRKDRNDRTRESLMLGAGFPLLFGGGVGAVAGGVGGALAQRGGKGFGAQILFSAIGQQFDKLISSMVSSTARLGQALGSFTQDTSQIVTSLGLAGTAEGERIKMIETLQGKQAAFNAAMQQLVNAVGEKGASDLKLFGDNLRLVSSEFRIFFTQIQAGLANLINAADRFFKVSQGAQDARLKRFAETTKNPEIAALRKRRDSITRTQGAGGRKKADIQKQIEALAGPMLAKQDAEVAIDKALMGENELLAKKKEQFELDKKIVELKKTGMSEALATEVAGLQQVFEKGTENLEADKKKLQETIRANNKLNISNDDNFVKLKEINKSLEDRVKLLGKSEAELKKYLDTQKQVKEESEFIKVKMEDIKETIASGMVTAVQGLIDGTKSLGESLAGIARSIGAMFLKAGFSNMLGSTGLFSAEGNYIANGIKPFASGGMVTRPTMGLVGEAGEDEYVIPASKMASSMQRYSAGARGQAVIPGTGQSSSGGASGSSTTVNYSGPILNFNSEEFVPKSAVGQIINSAASKGAAAGESRTMSTLRNSRGARARIGM